MDDTARATPRTLYDKIWDAHLVESREDGTDILYIDRHLVHEVTSPQAFEALRKAGRPVRRPELTLAVPDHNLPTTARRDAKGARVPIADPQSAAQLEALERNAPEFGIRYIGDADAEQGDLVIQFDAVDLQQCENQVQAQRGAAAHAAAGDQTDRGGKRLRNRVAVPRPILPA